MLSANAFEFTYLKDYNFTSVVKTEFGDLVACTADYGICKYAVGTEIKSAMGWTSVISSRAFDPTNTYFIITGTGGANPEHASAGGVALSKYSIQWEIGGLFLGSDLPDNFTGYNFFGLANTPFEYPSLVGTELFQFNDELIDRIYAVAQGLELEEIPHDLISYRELYEYETAKRSPFVAKCDTVSSNIYWAGDVAAANVEHYVSVLTNGTGVPCNTNLDDQGRAAALYRGAMTDKVDFSRVAMVKAFSNYDRPPPTMSAYQNRNLIGESATEVGLNNAWSVITAFIDEIINDWDSTYAKGVATEAYYGGICNNMGDKVPIFGGKCSKSAW